MLTVVQMPAMGIATTQGGTSAGPTTPSPLERVDQAANGKTDPVLHQEAVNSVSVCEWMEATAGAIISTS